MRTFSASVQARRRPSSPAGRTSNCEITLAHDITHALSHGAQTGQTALAGCLRYKGHNAPLTHKFRVFTAGQKRRVTPAIKREMRRRSAVEPVIGHIKTEHRMERNYLAGTQGDAINALLAAAGYNFSLPLKWLKALLCLILISCQMHAAPDRA